MTATVLLPILAFLGLWIVLASREGDMRSAFLRASLGWGVFSVALTEGLSVLNAVTPGGLAAGWGLLLAVSLVLGFRMGRRGALRSRSLPWPATLPEWASQIALGLLLGLTALVAYLAPPNTWDALNYQMARVAHWAQQRSIAHFATGIEVQNSMPPAAGIFVLQFYILGAGDRMVNFVQWFAMVGSMVGASVIAQRLEVGRWGQWLAAVFVATLPMGIMQATGTGTDFVVAFWMIVVGAELVELLRRGPERQPLVAVALAAGMAMLTKQTALFFLAPFAIVVALVVFRRRGLRRSLPGVLVGALGLVSLNLPFLLRNQTTYGGWTASPRQLSGQVNEVWDARVLVSNVLRDASLHMGIPLPHWNKLVALGIMTIHDWMGIDPNDPRTTAEGQFRVKPSIPHETVAGNSLHSLTILVVMVELVRNRSRVPGRLWIYSLLPFVGFVAMSATLKWRFTGSRYHLPFFVMLGPVVAYALERHMPRFAASIVAGLLLLTAFPWAVANQARPLWGGVEGSTVESVLVADRTDLYFANAPYLAVPFREMTGLIRQAGCTRIGMALPGGEIEYPIWAMLGAPSENVRLEWLVGGDPSARYSDPSFDPCAVFCDTCPSAWNVVRGLPEVYRRGNLRLFLGDLAPSP